MRRALGIVLLLAAPAAFADVVQELLAFPAPPPAGTRSWPILDEKEPPPEDAPLDQLAGWWATAPAEREPSDRVRERLVEVIEKRPDLLANLVNRLPVRPDVCAALKHTFLGKGEEPHSWILRNCASERDKLVVAATQIKERYDGSVPDSDDLIALAHADPKRAEPVLQQFAVSEHPRIRALAVSLLFEQTRDEPYRSMLQGIATDVAAPAYARNRAIETLAAVEWDGRDDWLVSLMSDGTLLEVTEAHNWYSPISSFVEADPERWIPRMVRLLSSTNRSVRSAAANALGQFDAERARADALQPLLPWLSNPDWAYDAFGTRSNVILSVAKAGIYEAIPHLVWILENDPDEGNKSHAAEALEQFHDGRGNEAMRRALDEMTRGGARDRVIHALVANGALPATELADGVEAFIAYQHSLPAPMMIPDMLWDDEGYPTPVMIGLHVIHEVHDNDDVARLVIKRAREIAEEEPKLSEAMLSVVQTWPVPSADELVVMRIQDGTADARMIADVLSRRESFRDHVSAALRRLRASGGATSGIAAVLIGDIPGEQRILAGNDVEAQRALLAAARFVGDRLPVANVVALFGKSQPLDAAVEAFLIADDSPAARAIVQKRHPNEILILGWRRSDPSGTYQDFSEWENDVLQRFRVSDAREIYALGSGTTWNAPSESVAEIEVRANGATIAISGDPQPRAALRNAVAKDFLGFLAASQFDDLGPVSAPGEGTQYEYLHLTRTSGRRVFLGLPLRAPASPYDEIVRRFESLVTSAFPPLKY